MKYRVGGAVHASTYIGEFEANSPQEAIEKAYNNARISVCHQCAEYIEDPEPAELWAEDENGNVTHEATSRPTEAAPDVSALEQRIAELDGRRREGRQLLRRLVKYVREDRAVTPGKTRLARLTDQVDDYLTRTHDPSDILRSDERPPEVAAPPGEQAVVWVVTDEDGELVDVCDSYEGAFADSNKNDFIQGFAAVTEKTRADVSRVPALLPAPPKGTP